MSLNCIIVDDEERAHTVLKHYINQLEDIELAGCCANVIEAYHFLNQHPVDVIFLDVQMPELDGFSLLQMTRTNAMVIFTTAHCDHALKSYDYNAIDYLLKPIRFERFVTAVEKARKWKKHKSEIPASETFGIKVNGETKVVAISDVLFAEGLGNYVKIYCKNTNYLTLITIKELAEKLGSSAFARIHKSYIVNLSRIDHIENESAFIGEQQIPIGKTYKMLFRELLEQKANKPG